MSARFRSDVVQLFLEVCAKKGLRTCLTRRLLQDGQRTLLLPCSEMLRVREKDLLHFWH